MHNETNFEGSKGPFDGHDRETGYDTLYLA